MLPPREVKTVQFIKQVNKPSSVYDGHLTNIRLWRISCSLPAGMTERITPCFAASRLFGIAPCRDCSFHSLVKGHRHCSSDPDPWKDRPALSGCIILWSSDFPLRRHKHQSGHPDLLFLKPDRLTHQPHDFARAAHAQFEMT